MKPLIIDDDDDIRDTLRVTLELQWPDATVIEAGDGATGIALAQSHLPDIVILDVNLPDMNGFDVCARLRATLQMPILMLTVMERDVDKVRGLEAGADDYLVKPFSHLELLARVKALLRRGWPSHLMPTQGVLKAGMVQLDNEARTVNRGERSVRLTNKEAGILSILLRNVDRTVSHRAVLASVWGPELVGETSYLKLYIHNIRQKLATIGCQPNAIESQRSVGYRFVSDPP